MRHDLSIVIQQGNKLFCCLTMRHFGLWVQKSKIWYDVRKLLNFGQNNSSIGNQFVLKASKRISYHGRFCEENWNQDWTAVKLCADNSHLEHTKYQIGYKRVNYCRSRITIITIIIIITWTSFLSSSTSKGKLWGNWIQVDNREIICWQDSVTEVLNS